MTAIFIGFYRSDERKALETADVSISDRSACTLLVVRILVDYRPALRDRTGVGEYIHQLVRAYTGVNQDEVIAFTSSWKDRPAPGLESELGARVIDRRIPVRVLNYLWHRREWPPVEMLAGPVDVAHSAHPLLMPARRAAQVITIHDLYFLSSAKETSAEIQRDYPRLAASHARRADAVITSTQYGKRQVVDRLGVPADRIYICPPGAPSWEALGRGPNVPADGCVLFVGTLEPRKNIGTLLDAYARLLSRRASMPRLVLAGRATPEASEWLTRIARAPLAGHVTHRGYVPNDEREALYASARLLVMPSLDEGFGLPALEAMSAGIPVIVSSRGSLPEVVDAAGALVDPGDAAALADAIERGVGDDEWALRAAHAGLARARHFTWADSAVTLRRAYADAVERRHAAHVGRPFIPRQARDNPERSRGVTGRRAE
jgi:glycosyltransferase involved in cell wall biosynthesis